MCYFKFLLIGWVSVVSAQTGLDALTSQPPTVLSDEQLQYFAANARDFLYRSGGPLDEFNYSLLDDLTSNASVWYEQAYARLKHETAALCQRSESYDSLGLAEELNRIGEEFDSRYSDRIRIEVIESSASGTVEMTPWISGSFNRQQAFDNALEKYPADSLSVGLAYRMLMSTASMQRLNVSSATYSEAIASGEMDTIQNTELRSALAQYYYRAAQFGETPDDRTESNWRHLRDVLAAEGLAIGITPSDENVFQVFKNDERLVAEIINTRELAVTQIMLSGIVSQAADELSSLVSQAIE